MREKSGVFQLAPRAKRLSATVLAIALTFANVPPVAAIEPVVGTVQVSGPAFAATASSDWTRISATRPLVAGECLKTRPAATSSPISVSSAWSASA